MTVSDGLVILAIIASPIIALRIQTWRDNRKIKKKRQMTIFRTLMATRGGRLLRRHVEALNMIDIEFHKNKKIVDAWKLLLDNFVHYPKDDDPNYNTKLSACSEKSNELLVGLLYVIAKELKYDFDKVHLQRNVYIPRGHAEVEYEQFIIRKRLLDLVSGETALPIKIVKSSKRVRTKKSKIKTSKKRIQRKKKK